MKLTSLRRREFLTSGALTVGAFSLPNFGWAAEDYPTKTIRIICTFSAGGSADTVSRILAEQLSHQLGQSVIVYDIPGAAGNIGAEHVKTSQPDGYTVLLANAGTVVINPSIYAHIPFNTVKDFVPVGKIGNIPMLVAGNPKLAAKNLVELIALSKTTPNGLDYGTPGIGSPQQMMYELINLRAGAHFNNIAYGGAAPAIIDSISGYLPLVGAALADAIPFVKAGKLRAFAISGASRSPYLPDVPTFAECGVKGIDFSSWDGLMVPANTPQPIVQKLNAQLNMALNDPAVRDHLSSIGCVVAPSTPEAFGEEIKVALAANAQLVKAANIKPIK